MNRSTLAACAICAAFTLVASLDTPARAADMARITKAPPVVHPATNWTGFYLGAMGGYAADNGGTFATSAFNMKGGFAGGTAGYNWQSGQFVGGIEADAAWADVKQSVSAFGVTVTDRIRSWGTVRARAGIAFDTVYLYGTGGYAWADNRISAAALGTTLFSDSKIHSGWAAGAGMEWMFAPSWSLKAEYLYRSFGSETYLTTFVPGGVPTGTIRFHSGQVGVNYHF